MSVVFVVSKKYMEIYREYDARPLTLRKMCPHSRIRTEYGEIRIISSYSVRMWENADKNNS